MPEYKRKNRRYRNSKISEYSLKKVVEYFAKRKTVIVTARQTHLSEPTITNIFWKLREHLRRYPIFDFGPMIKQQEATTEPSPMKLIYDKVHRGGSTPEQQALLSIEHITRAVTARKYTYVERLKASSPRQIEKARRLYSMNKPVRRYHMIEILKPGIPDELSNGNARPFDPSDYELSSVILVNERMTDPDASFFRYLWQLLLRYPL